MSKNQNPEITSGNDYHCWKTAKVQTNLLSKYYFGFNNRKSYFRASMFGSLDIFEQYFESCVLNTQNPFKGALNKVSGLITSKN